MTTVKYLNHRDFCPRWALTAALAACLMIFGGLWRADALQAREVRVVSASGTAGSNVGVLIELVSLGNENAVGFSLNFNPAILGNPVVSLGSGATGASLNVNANEAAAGRVGVALAFSSGQTFAAGTRQMVNVSFAIAANAAAGMTPITFGNQPVSIEVSDASANVLTAAFTPGNVTVQPANPSPTLIALSPNSALAGSPSFSLTVNGSNFVSTAVVRWNGSNRTTTFISGTQLTAVIPASDVAAAGTASVSAQNPAPGGGISNTLTFTINNPVPAITSISPNMAIVGASAQAVAVTGTGFVAGSKAQWNGAERATTFVSATQLIVQIPATDLAQAGNAAITILNPTPGGGASGSAAFTVNNPAPAIANLSPAGMIAGSAGFTLAVTGMNFISGSVIKFNGADRATSFVSATQLTTPLTSADIASSGTAQVSVFNPAPGGGVSSSANFTINAQPAAQIAITPASPTVNDSITAQISGVWPNSCIPGNAQVSTSGSEIRVNTSNSGQVCLQVLSNWTLTAPLGMRAAGSYALTVNHTDGLNNQFSLGKLDFTVNNLAPTLAGLSPASALAGGQPFNLTVTGTNFTGGSVVRWNDADRPTTFVSATQLRAAIPAADIAAQGTAGVRVFTPAPGGGATTPLSFVIAGALASVSAASFLGEQIASESIVAAFGVNLATRTEIATAVPLPTTLAGTTVSVRDSAGVERLAPLFFVAGGQVNYQMAPGTAPGDAAVTATSGDSRISLGTARIAATAPGLFSANANGQGVAAATALRVKANGDQTFEPIARFDTTQNRFVSIPIDLGPETDQVFLVLSGTGVRFRTALSAVNIKLGGTDGEALFAAAAPGFVGLDQINVRVPRSLIGRGEIDLVMIVDGKPANTLRINIK
ncbi:MAG: IPT/TIG domain-containing protein [Blastocatellia bacterium]